MAMECRGGGEAVMFAAARRTEQSTEHEDHHEDGNGEQPEGCIEQCRREVHGTARPERRRVAGVCEQVADEAAGCREADEPKPRSRPAAREATREVGGADRDGEQPE